MKGYFSLNYCPYTEEVQFGNLRDDIGTLGSLLDTMREGSRTPMLIAHDVIEHAANHRTNTYVTYEGEMRAVGAIGFVRGSDSFDLYSELLNQADQCWRDVKAVPHAIGKFLLDGGWVSTSMIRHLIQNDVTPDNARNSVYQFAWGQWQKTMQFDLDDYKARNAFGFIENNVSDVLRGIYQENYNVAGASVYFDTEKHIFRWQFKRPH